MHDSMTCEENQPTSLLGFLWVGGVGGIWFDGIRTVVRMPSSCRDTCKNSTQNAPVDPVDI